MSIAPLLDTHAWIWWLHGDARVGLPALKKLDQLPLSLRPAISDISLWEVATLSNPPSHSSTPRILSAGLAG